MYGSNGNLKGHPPARTVSSILYHQRIAPEISEDRAAWAFTWEEGLATYVSQLMNPACDSRSGISQAGAALELARPHLPNIARQILDRADSTNPNDYIAFFRADSFRPPAAQRVFCRLSGGKETCRHPPLVELVHLRGPQLKLAVLNAPTELQKPA